MGRVTQAQAQQNRSEVVRAASHLFRERGVEGVSVADLMAEVGLTHGGFYKQFESKEHLLGEATAHAFEQMSARLDDFDEASGGDHVKARDELLDFYLSDTNRDDFREGCPATGLAADIARRESPDSAAHTSYVHGVESFARWMSESGDELNLAAISTMVGALTLARATAGTELSERILADARSFLKNLDR